MVVQSCLFQTSGKPQRWVFSRCGSYDVSIAGIHSSHIDIYLLSLEDGRRSLVQTTQTLCEQVAQRQFRTADITPHCIDTLLQGKVLPEKNSCTSIDIKVQITQMVE